MVTTILIKEVSNNEVEISLDKEIFSLVYDERLDTTFVTNIWNEFLVEIERMQYDPNRSQNDYPNNIILGKLYELM